MTTFNVRGRVIALAVSMITLSFSLSAVADDVASFATGGYSAGLRSKEMMSIIDTDGDGTISRPEWDAFQEKVFKALDTHKRDKLSVAIFSSRTEVRLGSDLATGGYARGLSSAELAHKIDANGDGWISHEEWTAYKGKIFDMMNTSVTHKGEIGHEEMFATGGANRP
jgi:EF hand